MTADELEELIYDCPRIYHMAERGAWEGVKRHGLLSTSALLDLYGIAGEIRERIETKHRPSIVIVSDENIGRAAIRDQIPMSDSGLKRALPEHVSPAEWYACLNSKVFFWMSEARLFRLTTARAYRDVEHEVLVLDSRTIIKEFYDKIWLCPINSGCTKPMPHPRDFGIFQRIDEYDYAHWRQRRKRGERVVELCVDHSVTDVERFAVDGFVVRGEERLCELSTPCSSARLQERE